MLFRNVVDCEGGRRTKWGKPLTRKYSFSFVLKLLFPLKASYTTVGVRDKIYSFGGYDSPVIRLPIDVQVLNTGKILKSTIFRF